ncbi:hypothetical protein [Peptostreptococcus porci]|uniref:hypothetical protein n=1 Tax=Peptostreptococcus porci TaxID=2652282 RepID=UPI002A8363E9|nr:hypothetical protein [Peptostreptococcus porci]MDY4127625.1 hypothetical protein [Peptostreptococcus porci]
MKKVDLIKGMEVKLRNGMEFKVDYKNNRVVLVNDKNTIYVNEVYNDELLVKDNIDFYNEKLDIMETKRYYTTEGSGWYECRISTRIE